MHDSDTVKLLLSVTSHPIMEDSQGIVIGAYRLDPRSPVLRSHDNSSEVRFFTACPVFVVD
jgi:hypothetical protein